MYRHKLYPSDKIEFVGMKGYSDLMFRYPLDKWSDDVYIDSVFFSISKETFWKYYIKDQLNQDLQKNENN